MAQKKPHSYAAEHASAVKNKKLVQAFKKREHWMKWVIIVALIVILLLLLLVGYATNWTQGLRRSNTSAPLASQVDSQLQGESGTATRSGASNTSRESTSTVTEKTTVVQQPTDNGGTGDRTGLLDALLTLYNDTNVGDNLDETITRAEGLGINVTCTNDFLLEKCTFEEGGASFVTRRLLGTSLIAGIETNF